MLVVSEIPSLKHYYLSSRDDCEYHEFDNDTTVSTDIFTAPSFSDQKIAAGNCSTLDDPSIRQLNPLF